jgi:hypothetical protein
MTRRLEAGPLLVTLGALLLLASLFLDWFTGEISAWAAFEVWDVVLFALALGAIAAGLGLALTEVQAVDHRWLPGAAAAAAIVVASQIIDPPPAAAGQDADTGAWLAFGAALVMCAGVVLTFGRVRFAVTVEGREPRQRVAAVDARGAQEATTESQEPVTSPTARLFGRDRTDAPAEAGAVEAGAGEPPAREAGNPEPEEKQD